MTVIGSLTRSRSIALNKFVIETATGPSTAVTVAATSTANVSIPISSELRNDIQYIETVKIAGLPANLLASQIDFSPTAITLRVTNPTASAITIAANSLTVTYVAMGS
jgi:hypothetical protein